MKGRKHIEPVVVTGSPTPLHLIKPAQVPKKPICDASEKEKQKLYGILNLEEAMEYLERNHYC